MNAATVREALDAADLATTPVRKIAAAQIIARELNLPLVLDDDDAERVIAAGRHRLKVYTATRALLA